jgi:hypothetical protein
MKTWFSGPGQRQAALSNDKKRRINPKHEIRNSKQYSMTKIQMFQSAVVLEVANTILFWTFGNLKFEFVSDFAIRISNFTKSPFKNMPSGLNSKPSPPFGPEAGPGSLLFYHKFWFADRHLNVKMYESA